MQAGREAVLGEDRRPGGQDVLLTAEDAVEALLGLFLVPRAFAVLVLLLLAYQTRKDGRPASA